MFPPLAKDPPFPSLLGSPAAASPTVPCSCLLTRAPSGFSTAFLQTPYWNVDTCLITTMPRLESRHPHQLAAEHRSPHRCTLLAPPDLRPNCVCCAPLSLGVDVSQTGRKPGGDGGALPFSPPATHLGRPALLSPTAPRPAARGVRCSPRWAGARQDAAQHCEISRKTYTLPLAPRIQRRPKDPVPEGTMAPPLLTLLSEGRVRPVQGTSRLMDREASKAPAQHAQATA